MRRSAVFARLDPIDTSAVERVSSSPIFDELQRAIMATPPEEMESADDGGPSLRLHNRPRYVRPVAAFVVLAAVVTLAGLLVIGGGNAPNSPTATSQQSGTWKLADDQLSGTWKQ